MKKTIALLAVPAALVGIAMSAEAAPANRSGATLLVSSSDGARVTSTTTAGSSLVFSGCGYTAGEGVRVSLITPSAYVSFGGRANSEGCFSTAATQNFTAHDAGNYSASTWQSNSKRALASTTFTVTN